MEVGCPRHPKACTVGSQLLDGDYSHVHNPGKPAMSPQTRRGLNCGQLFFFYHHTNKQWKEEGKEGGGGGGDKLHKNCVCSM